MSQVTDLVQSGGFVMYPLLICSLLVWAVIFERLWRFRRLGHELRSFQLEATNHLLRNEPDSVRNLCSKHADLPTARLLMTALERLGARDERLRENWAEALERKRQMENQALRSNLWILGTIANAAPFIGLFGTVVGILKSFQDMARTGAGGFTVVAAGISEALIATAAGIVVAVVAVIAFNTFQNRVNHLVLTIKLHVEELSEILAGTHASVRATSGPSNGA